MSVPYWAVRGAPVVCIVGCDDPRFDPIEEGCVYIVREVVVRLGVGFYLEGKTNPHPVWGESAYRIERFRPVITHDDETEASIFRAKHHTTPVREGV